MDNKPWPRSKQAHIGNLGIGGKIVSGGTQGDTPLNVIAQIAATMDGPAQGNNSQGYNVPKEYASRGEVRITKRRGFK